MRTFFLTVSVISLGGWLLASNAAAFDWPLVCTGDLSGETAADQQRVKGVRFGSVTVAGANSLREACMALSNDPLYGDYNWRSCVDAKGRGSCRDAMASTPAAGTSPPNGPGMPPSPPINVPSAGAAGTSPSTGIGMPPSPPIGPVSVEPSVNRPGFDYMAISMPQPDPRQCAAYCERDPRCAAYTFVLPGYQGPNAVCWLKSQAPPPVTSPCCVSGAR